PTSAGAFQTIHKGGNDVFVTKLNPTGTSLIYSTYLGGTKPDFGTGIVVDGSGNAYVTGYTQSSDFPTTARAVQTINQGFQNAFVPKLNAGGTALAYSTYLGGSSTDYGDAIAIDGSGDAYVTGYTQSTDFRTTADAFQSTKRGLLNAFVTK